MATTKKEPLQRRTATLSCKECRREITLLLHEDPQHGDGWPTHRCPVAREVRAFDTYSVVIPAK